MELEWSATALAFNFIGDKLPEDGKIRRFTKVVAQPSVEQLNAFGHAIAALGVNETVVDAEVTTKQIVNLG